VIERAIAFGSHGGLVGIMAEPVPARPGTPVFLFWNVGIQHRIGPYRIQVDLARELARRGFASLRFDLSGMGDSEVRQDAQVDQQRALGDAREAMAWLEKRLGARTFVPIGFCSSVDSAHVLSVQDARVVGACFLEGYAYRTPGFWLRYPGRLLDRHRWRRYVTARLDVRAGRVPVDPRAEERALMGSIFARKYPSPAQFAADVRALVTRGVRTLFVYFGGDTDFNHHGQFREMVRARYDRAVVDVAFYAEADHTLFRVEDRERVVRRVVQWASRSFGETPVSR
jgi:hypothetical protein